MKNYQPHLLVKSDLDLTGFDPQPSTHGPPACCHLFVVGGIACLSDPDSDAGWSFYTPVRARLVEG